jgi:hypothetical protein
VSTRSRADFCNVLAQSVQLLGGFELVDDLHRGVSGATHGDATGPVWPDEYSHASFTSVAILSPFLPP